jgi:hypothetical protein
MNQEPFTPLVLKQAKAVVSFRAGCAKKSARTFSGPASFAGGWRSCLSVLHDSGILGLGVNAVPEHPDSGFEKSCFSIAADG